MSASMKCLISTLVLLLPLAAAAQSNDVGYCVVLSERYSRYLDAGSKKGSTTQGLDARFAVEKCKAGDAASSIPVLEKALKDAKLELPPRT